MEKFTKLVNKSLSTNKGNETHVFLSYNPNQLKDVKIEAIGDMGMVASLLLGALVNLDPELRANVYTHLTLQDYDLLRATVDAHDSVLSELDEK